MRLIKQFFNPLTDAEIARCQADPQAVLVPV